MSVNILFKNREFDGVRFTYTRADFPSGTIVDQTYSEGSGNRYYFNILGSTASEQMEAATFQSFISVTMSGAVTHFIELVPMEPGELVYFDMTVTSVNGPVDKGFVANPKGSFIHTGSDILPVGGTAGLTYDIRTDFTSVNTAFIINATASVALGITCESGETLDWNLFVDYKKSFHSISSPPGPTGPPKPIYPIAR
jgi:hypothetical protein